jgi:3-dehydroquinate synthase class II
MLIEAKTGDGTVHSLLLQNAETVRLVGPVSEDSSAGRGEEQSSKRGSKAGWMAIPVSQMQVGDKVYVWQQDAARHTGINIQESIVEQ